MFRFIKNKFLFIILISIVTLVLLVVGGVSLYKDSSLIFDGDGYILSTTTKKNSKYYFSLDNKTGTSYDDLYLIVYQYNPENNTTLKRIQILLGTNELIDLFDLIYFTFLIDMVSNNFESIYG